MLRNTAWTPVLDRLKARCQEAESERDALRAEVDRYKVVLEWMVHPSWCDNCPLPESWRLQCGAGNCREVLAQWALSEAGK